MYSVILSRSAERFLNGLSGKDYNLVSAAVSSLLANPYQSGCKKLKGYKEMFRIRAGNYRILYQVDGEKLIVEIFEVGNRRNVYD
ncbi:type II toxin-antitoxin system RelE/ParE family toxin [Dyadobacter sp. CY343]|uniref:type II toxin-antitoxin system RelE family toxin n=1 Tax=Dyadobacter sp. CY343 TaxID=2907299 RepID=UPI001F349CE0|nr:type II toxin-antitoxin system RelE/ParE family toxin [Dyadobacter sp. CY343]MCE7063084.1 type II toxin-antitoxin system RelE/ParE family toxin [Dyadobacter sp. CY343]